MDNKIFAYIRVSSKDQNIDRQLEAIKGYCLSNNIQLSDRDIFIDRQSGKDFNRPSYQTLKCNCLRGGDTLIIKELDRLGRDMQMVKEEWQELIKQGINIIVIDTPLLTTKDKSDLEKLLISNIVFELLTYMAEKERIKIRQRQREGIVIALERGKPYGRPKQVITQDFIRVYEQWKAGAVTALKAMELLNMKRNTFYRRVKEYEILK